MKGKNQVSKEEMSTVIGKWFTMTSKDEAGNMYQHVIYCKEVLENGEVLFAPVNPDPSLDWDKLSKVDMVHYDMAPINNFIYRYFNTLLNKVTLKGTGLPEIMEELMFLTCFAMVTDEKLYGNDCLSITEHIRTKALRRIWEENADKKGLLVLYGLIHQYMTRDLRHYLSLYAELDGETERVDNLSMEPGCGSLLDSSEWAEEKEWCSSHPLVYLEDSVLCVSK
jgi:hypothetical protein